MKTVVAYTRVSTDGQVDGYGLEAQRRTIQEYCDAHGMYIAHWYVEEGVSGVKDSRPEFDKLLYGEIDNPPVEAVVVAKNDRVSRDINVYYYFKMLLRKKNIELISVAEDFGNMGIMASFLEAFTLCVAELERENITRRTSAGRKMKAKNGGYAGGRPPYGYRVQDRALVVDETEAKAVRAVYEMRERGMTLKGIAHEMTQRGYRTQKGLEFTEGTIQNILKNERIYRGKLRYNGEYVGTHQAIL